MKNKATRGDIGRISILLLLFTIIAALLDAFIFFHLKIMIFLTILTFEYMAISGYFALTGDLYDFSGIPDQPRGWVAATYLEERP